MVNYAQMNNLDCIKGYAKIIKDNKTYDINRIFSTNQNNLKIIKEIISSHSFTPDIIVKRDFLNKNNIRFHNNFPIDGFKIFYISIFSNIPKIHYYDSFFYYQQKISIDYTSTHKFGDKELNENIKVWKIAEQKLKKIGISYYELWLSSEVKNTIGLIISHSNGNLSKKSFNKLHLFLNTNICHLKNYLILHERYEAVFKSIVENDFENFLLVSKKRLLVNGYDLKFIEPALKYLENDYAIKIDKWANHNEHDVQKSLDLLNWADDILCEWLLGNSVWYSQRKMSHQKLIIRAHKFELTRDFGTQVNYDNVDGIIAVSYYFLELFCNTFNIAREKMILLGNYVETDIYSEIKPEGFSYNIAIVGYMPQWKGLLKGLEIIRMLKEHDEKFKLYLIGNNYKEVDWVWNSPKEREYFRECENYIQENNLESSIIFQGWTDRSELFNDIGYVISVSDIESFHLAPAEGLVASTLAFLLNWDGVEYVYPQQIIFNNINEIKDMILSTYKDDIKYYRLLKEMKDYIIKEYDFKRFVEGLKMEFFRNNDY